MSVISESDFIVLINEMVGGGEIMQIKQRFSMPYSFGATLATNSQNVSTTTSNRSIVLEYSSQSPSGAIRPPERPLVQGSEPAPTLQRPSSARQLSVNQTNN